MQDTAKAILTIFKNLNFKAYYNGEKCRNELYNDLNRGKHLKAVHTTIVTNALASDIQRIFPHAVVDEHNPMRFFIDFGNENIVIESFHKQTYYLSDGKTETFLAYPQVKHVDTLDEDFERKVFTINCVAQDLEENNYYGVSAHIDMDKKIIQTIQKDKKVFYEYPIRTLQAFVLMSQTGYTISKDTLKYIRSTMRYLRFMPSELVGKELRKIIVGQYVVETFKLMNKLGIFNSKCLIDNDKKEKILETFHNCSPERFEVLNNFRISKEIEMELWSVLFDSQEQAYKELSKFHCFSEKELHTIMWIMNNQNICESKTDIEMRNNIYNSLTDFEKENGIHYLKELIIKLNHIYKIIHKNDIDKKTLSKKLMFNLCCRPYFVNQITWNISDENKQKLIPKLLNEVNYPVTEDEIKQYIKINLGDEM